MAPGNQKLTRKRNRNWSSVGVQGCSGITHRQLDLEAARVLGVLGTYMASLPSTSTELWGSRTEGCSSLPPIHPVRMLGYEKKVEVAK